MAKIRQPLLNHSVKAIKMSSTIVAKLVKEPSIFNPSQLTSANILISNNATFPVPLSQLKLPPIPKVHETDRVDSAFSVGFLNQFGLRDRAASNLKASQFLRSELGESKIVDISAKTGYGPSRLIIHDEFDINGIKQPDLSVKDQRLEDWLDTKMQREIDQLLDDSPMYLPQDGLDRSSKLYSSKLGFATPWLDRLERSSLHLETRPSGELMKKLISKSEAESQKFAALQKTFLAEQMDELDYYLCVHENTNGQIKLTNQQTSKQPREGARTGSPGAAKKQITKPKFKVKPETRLRALKQPLSQLKPDLQPVEESKELDITQNDTATKRITPSPRRFAHPESSLDLTFPEGLPSRISKPAQEHPILALDPAESRLKEEILRLDKELRDSQLMYLNIKAVNVISKDSPKSKKPTNLVINTSPILEKELSNPVETAVKEVELSLTSKSNVPAIFGRSQPNSRGLSNTQKGATDSPTSQGKLGYLERHKFGQSFSSMKYAIPRNTLGLFSGLRSRDKHEGTTSPADGFSADDPKRQKPKYIQTKQTESAGPQPMTTYESAEGRLKVNPHFNLHELA